MSLSCRLVRVQRLLKPGKWSFFLAAAIRVRHPQIGSSHAHPLIQGPSPSMTPAGQTNFHTPTHTHNRAQASTCHVHTSPARAHLAPPTQHTRARALLRCRRPDQHNPTQCDVYTFVVGGEFGGLTVTCAGKESYTPAAAAAKWRGGTGCISAADHVHDSHTWTAPPHVVVTKERERMPRGTAGTVRRSAAAPQRRSAAAPQLRSPSPGRESRRRTAAAPAPRLCFAAASRRSGAAHHRLILSITVMILMLIND